MKGEHYGVVEALVAVILLQFLPKPVHFHANYGISTRIEIRRPAQGLDRQIVFLDVIRFTFPISPANASQEYFQVRTPGKYF
jgi:hypothetical protein